MSRWICAVDVGTRSARAALFDLRGKMERRAVVAFPLFSNHDADGSYRSSDIWRAVAVVVRRACAGIDPSDVGALAIDATCSLVLTGVHGTPLVLDDAGQDTIAWFDRRGVAEAQACTRAGGASVDALGGAMSPEMQVPKLLWLQRQRPELWAQLGQAQDLTDHLVSRAVGMPVRGLSSLVAKWPFAVERGGWDEDLLRAVGLNDLRERAGLPEECGSAVPVAARAGTLCASASEDLGLPEGLCVSSGMIDGYAGALGCGAIQPEAVALIAGTSASVIAHRAMTPSLDGWWGTFTDVMAPGTRTVEAGLADAGAVLDRVIESWPKGAPRSHDQVLSRIARKREEIGVGFGADIHVLPDERGLRGPVKEAPLKAVVHGMPTHRGPDALAAYYWRTAGAVALSIADIMERVAPDLPVAAVGGMMRSPVFTQAVADATGRCVIVPDAVDGVLLGTAICGAVAAGMHPDLTTASTAMSPGVRRTEPQRDGVAQMDRDRVIRARMAQHRAGIAGV
ncbi:FGGY-family carbohydrate kinase [Maritimibacter sp. DP1N21-5]|uniref:FGGY-family carbohydrate kinase n=1 Tax=Maritimibacter sp. DP1N21-5 TaxID=2836867 RepID=UPI001C4828B8|nr:FGGY-family carbohydrate kinase [Maritimibacter sp. DP1N21-5]MBV7411082.1 hypothetical protein [Maritimibacter sp. DP1N21-5]